jgi:hypothetical protein
MIEEQLTRMMKELDEISEHHHYRQIPQTSSTLFNADAFVNILLNIVINSANLKLERHYNWRFDWDIHKARIYENTKPGDLIPISSNLISSF